MKMGYLAMAVLMTALAHAGGIEFDSPAENDHGSMMLGNGMLGANAWVSADGVLHARFQRQDSWNEVGEHVKVGEIEYVTGRAVDGGYHQSLDVGTGVFSAEWLSCGEPVTVSCRVQNELPACRFVVEIKGADDAFARTVSWRRYDGGAKDFGALELQIQFEEPSTVDPLTGEMPVFTINADTMVEDGWYHENRRETTEKLYRLYGYWQGTDELPRYDPFGGRVFGALTRKFGSTFVTAVNSRIGSVEEWLAETRGQLAVPDIADHLARWKEFWSRSHINIEGDEGARVSAAWRNQRYMTALAGRGGAFPIRFNGSIFTTHEGADPDWRRWGHGYWWQNTRLPYYPMLTAGDGDLMEPLFELYSTKTLEFFKERTRKYFGHGGAYFPECMVATGYHFFNCYGTLVKWEDRADKHQDFGWHRREWIGQLELCWLMLDYLDFTGDEVRFKRDFLPTITEFIRFFDEHYQVGEDGRYIWEPAQALETWWDVRDPLPEIAGLTAVTRRMIALGCIDDETRGWLKKVNARIPPLPTMERDGKRVYAPGSRFAVLMNVELPELCGVFPFRLSTFATADREMAIDTFETRTQRRYSGWNQDELIAAYLGLTEDARSHLVDRVMNNSNAEFRWPAFWGPNYDWMPDQCAGGNIQNIIQSMLVQYDGRVIHLLPAWPKEWNAEFKVHAPYQTVLEGRVENGKIVRLEVTPSERMKDVVMD